MDGVGGVAAGGAEEGVKVEWFMEPFFGEDDGEAAGGAENRGGETAGAEGGAVDEEEELVGGSAAIGARVEGDGEWYAGRSC